MNTNQKQKPDVQKTGCIGCLTIIVVIVLAAVVISFMPKESEYSYEADVINAPEYEIIKSEDLSLGTYVRVNYNIAVDDSYSEDDLKKVTEEIVETEKSKQPTSSVSISFFSKEIDPATNERVILGDAVWSPYGKWDKSMEVEPGEYSHHEYVYDLITDRLNQAD